MKSLSVSERYGWARYVGHQVYYSLVGRDYEWELMPLALDQGVGALSLEPARLGPPHRQNPPRHSPSPPTQPPAKQNGRRRRPHPRLGVRLQSSRRPRRARQRDRQNRPPARPQLAPPAPHHLHRSSSAPATKNNSAPTSPPPAGTSPPSKSPSSTQPANSPCLPLLAPGGLRRSQSVPRLGFCCPTYFERCSRYLR